MPKWMVFSAYGSAVILALLLLFFFRRKGWYLHLFALLLAFGVGLTPLPQQWQGPMLDLVVGSLFLFLFFWGVSAPIFGRRR